MFVAIPIPLLTHTATEQYSTLPDATVVSLTMASNGVTFTELCDFAGQQSGTVRPVFDPVPVNSLDGHRYNDVLVQENGLTSKGAGFGVNIMATLEKLHSRVDSLEATNQRWDEDLLTMHQDLEDVRGANATMQQQLEELQQENAVMQRRLNTIVPPDDSPGRRVE